MIKPHINSAIRKKLNPHVRFHPSDIFDYPDTSPMKLVKMFIAFIDLVRDRRQSSLLILREFNRRNKLLFPLKPSENHWFSDDLKGNRSSLIRLNLLNIRSEIWQPIPTK